MKTDKSTEDFPERYVMHLQKQTDILTEQLIAFKTIASELTLIRKALFVDTSSSDKNQGSA